MTPIELHNRLQDTEFWAGEGRKIADEHWALFKRTYEHRWTEGFSVWLEGLPITINDGATGMENLGCSPDAIQAFRTAWRIQLATYVDPWLATGRLVERLVETADEFGNALAALMSTTAIPARV
jgi:hypothetical protein